VLDQFWTKVGALHPLDRFQYAYDANSNRLYRDNLVNPLFGELYHAHGASAALAYDRLNRLNQFYRGDIFASTASGPIKFVAGVPSRSQQWALDVLGN